MYANKWIEKYATLFKHPEIYLILLPLYIQIFVNKPEVWKPTETCEIQICLCRKKNLVFSTNYFLYEMQYE